MRETSKDHTARKSFFSFSIDGDTESFFNFFFFYFIMIIIIIKLFVFFSPKNPKKKKLKKTGKKSKCVRKKLPATKTMPIINKVGQNK